MSLIALLSLSPAPAAAAAVATRPPKIVELHQRRTTFQSSARRNSLVTSLKPQHTHARLQVSNKKTRYRSSFAAGFSLDAPERVDRLFALNDITSRRTSSSSSTSSATSDTVPELLLAPETDLFAPQSSFGLFMNGLRFLPPSTWRKQSDGGASIASSSSSFATTATSSSSNDANNNVSSTEALVASSAKPPLRPQDAQHADRSMALHQRRQSPARGNAKPTVCVPTRIRRVVWSKSPTSLRHKHQSERHRVARAANAKLSTSLMAKKLTRESHAATGSPSTRSFPVSHDSDVSYVIDEDALAHRFYHELESTESIATTTSNVSTPPSSPLPPALLLQLPSGQIEPRMREVDDRERAWRAQQLELERQVAALQAETQAKNALVQYLMDANARLVSECVCRVSRALSVSSVTEQPVDTSACAPGGRAQRSSSDLDRAAPGHIKSLGDMNDCSSFPYPPTRVDDVPNTTDSAAVVRAVNWKLLEPTTEGSLDDVRKPFAVMDNAVAFDGLVQEIKAEFSMLFQLERRA